MSMTDQVTTLRSMPAAQNRKIKPIATGAVNVNPKPLRSLNDELIKHLAASMERLGLMTPITVRYHEDIPSDDGVSTDSYELIAGRHRLAAAQSLGWEEIDAVEIECSDVDARLWEISENLHRADLTTLQRDEQVALWIKLTDKVAQVAPVSGGRGNEGGVNAASRELGVDRTDAQRAVKVASLSSEAKAAAIEHGLDDNRTALLEAAREKDPEAQVAKIVARAGEIADRKNKNTGAATNKIIGKVTEDDEIEKKVVKNTRQSSGDDDDSEVASPEVVEENILYAIARINENSNAFNKILKLSALDREAASRISVAIDRAIGKLRLVKSTLEKKQKQSSCALPAEARH
jgi:ParB/RepB/Spo0J family partition protein